VRNEQLTMKEEGRGKKEKVRNEQLAMKEEGRGKKEKVRERLNSGYLLLE
jgi:hypothetical protein